MEGAVQLDAQKLLALLGMTHYQNTLLAARVQTLEAELAVLQARAGAQQDEKVATLTPVA